MSDLSCLIAFSFLSQQSVSTPKALIDPPTPIPLDPIVFPFIPVELPIEVIEFLALSPPRTPIADLEP